MATPADLALQRQLQAPESAASPKVVTALWVLGLFTASVAITLAVREPLPVPGRLHKNAYFLTLSVAFFAGVAGVMAVVCIEWPTTPTATGRRATGDEARLLYRRRRHRCRWFHGGRFIAMLKQIELMRPAHAVSSSLYDE
ncbi:unnamed protein product [Miscanthus lutarioriparius]|uniref:Uncharacterized protein n=1 Tax=Miscanthus lutarioriparius TaxID=422564 RepID=A0A811PC97_9POAL|nr:unnamed protein product [Miscanthus lutarioriparius]